jgi:hypothetical protein
VRDLSDFVKRVPGFASWPHAAKVRFFAWYLHTFKAKETFSAADIAHCYEALNLSPPSAVGPFLVAMAARHPKEALGKSGAYRLEARIRERFDSQYGQRPATVQVERMLSELPARVANFGERAYLEEALICFRNKAFRASIVMAWNLAFDHLCRFILANHLSEFNTQLPKSFPKADIAAVAKRDDFHELKESQVLQVCRSANIISGSIHKILKEKLDRRNIAAHPSGVVIADPTAEEFIKDLVENVVLKLV